MSDYKTVKKEGEAELIEKKSRFIGHAIPCEKEEEALLFIEKIKSKYYDARHNVYAYIIKENNIMRYTDDGEPSGTAGIPVLDILKKEELTNVCVVITRYFGGTLLGTGGLVRAYSKTAKDAVSNAIIINKKMCFVYKLKASYNFFGAISNKVIEMDCIMGETEYSDNVLLTVYVPEKTVNFENIMIDITNGNIEISKSDEKIYVDD